MPKKIPEETKKLVEKLNAEGLTKAEIARKAGISYASVYGLIDLKERGFSSLAEYQEQLARKKGFSSYAEYQEQLARKKRKDPLNKELSDLIKKRLKELNKTQTALSEEIGVSFTSVQNYINRKSIPNKENLEKLFKALELPYKTLEDFIDEFLFTIEE